MTSPSSESTPASSSDGTDLLGNERSNCEPDSTQSRLPASSADASAQIQTSFSDCATCATTSRLTQAATHDQLELAVAPVGKRCYRCQKVLPIEAFARMTYKAKPGVEFRNPRCNRCRAIHDAGTPRCQRNLKLVAERKEQPCADCGGKFAAVCMDFDHVRGEKSFNIAAGVRWKSTEALLAEMSKCDLVCANCHRVRTAGRIASGEKKQRGGRPAKFLAELPHELVEVIPGRRSLWRTYRRRA